MDETLFAALTGVMPVLPHPTRPRVVFTYQRLERVVSAFDMTDALRIKRVLKDEHNIDAEVYQLA